MLVVQETVGQSLLDTIIQNGGIDFTNILKDSFLNETLMYKNVSWLNPIVSREAENPNATVDFSIKLDEVYSLSFQDNLILANGTVTFTFKTIEGELLTSYRLHNMNLNVSVENRPRYA